MKKTSLVLSTLLILFAGCAANTVFAINESVGSYIENFYQKFNKDYCVNNPYNCRFDGSIVGVAVDDFLKQLYKEVDSAFASSGFTDVQFEYCKKEERCYRVIDNEEVKLRTSWTNDNYVKNGPYQITKQYPGNKSWYRANGGVNRYLGVHFYKTLLPSEYDKYCSQRHKTGKKLNKKIPVTKNTQFSEIFDYYKPDHKVLYRTFLPNLVGFDPSEIPSLESSCLIVDKRLFIPTQVDKEVSFRIKRKTVIFFSK